MSKIFFPAVFHPETVGFSLWVPDLEGCNSQGDTLEEAYAMAAEAIGLCVTDLLESQKQIPDPSNPHNVEHDPEDFVILIAFDLTEYQRRHNSKAVKKTLTIPAWLNAAAEEKHVNFSGVLQQALMDQLNLSE